MSESYPATARDFSWLDEGGQMTLCSVSVLERLAAKVIRADQAIAGVPLDPIPAHAPVADAVIEPVAPPIDPIALAEIDAMCDRISARLDDFETTRRRRHGLRIESRGRYVTQDEGSGR